MTSSPHELAIRPLSHAIDTRVRIPGSKSLSNRALLIAGLAEGESSLIGLLDSDDTRVMARAIGQLGARIKGELSERVSVAGIAGNASVP
ncbi:MAG TPA: hypothetical protein VHZ95_07680, partial [Polyangiales bacterium]|nr:hypothetical protein [Polyangiales bacterium]